MLDPRHQWPRLKSLFNRVTNWDGFWWIVTIACVLIAVTLLSSLFWEDLHGGQESFSTTIRNLGLVTGGIVAMLLAVWRSQVAARQADTAQQSLLNEQYQQGAEMLGSEVLSVRLGGIYALERLAAEHPEKYHIQVMKLFCSFVRNPKEDKSIVVKARPKFMGSSLREDVQAVLTTIGNRSPQIHHLTVERASATLVVGWMGSQLAVGVLIRWSRKPETGPRAISRPISAVVGHSAASAPG